MSGGEGGFSFLDIYFLFIFLVAVWVVGKISIWLKMPSIVGEIVTGLILGPHLLDLAPYPTVLKLIGECGLILLVIEAGIEVDLDILRVIGPRGVLVACFGSITPLLIGFGIAMALGFETTTSLACGAVLAPTSMGIAVDVLKRGGALNSQIGQLVIAAAVLDDIISLVLLSLIQALAHPTAWGIIQPILVSGLFLGVFGYIGIAIMPKILHHYIEMFDRENRTKATLGLVFMLALAMIPATNYAGTSYLLGAFLTGLCFCSDHHVHKIWAHQMKRLMHWLLRLFFSCTIGFEVPIQDVWTGEIIRNTFLFFIPVVGKLATAIFAPPPFRWIDGFKLGSAMSAWGEFAFIIATVSRDDHLLDKDQFSSLVMSVLLSVICGPVLLTYFLKKDALNQEGKLHEIREKMINDMIDPSQLDDVFFVINTESKGFWGFYDAFQGVMQDMSLEELDHQSTHQVIDQQTKFCTEYYVHCKKDFYGGRSATETQDLQVEGYRRDIIRAIFNMLQDKDAKISVKRWLPDMSGHLDDDDEEMDEQEQIDSMKRTMMLNQGRRGSFFGDGGRRGSVSTRKGRERRQSFRDLQLKRRHSVKELFLTYSFQKRSSVEPETNLYEILRHFMDEEITAVLVARKMGKRRAVKGLFTTTDYMNAHLKYGSEADDIEVGEIMTPLEKLVMVDYQMTRSEILSIMARENYHHMVLINQIRWEVVSLVDIKSLCAEMVKVVTDEERVWKVLTTAPDNHDAVGTVSELQKMSAAASVFDSAGVFTRDDMMIEWDDVAGFMNRKTKTLIDLNNEGILDMLEEEGIGLSVEDSVENEDKESISADGVIISKSNRI